MSEHKAQKIIFNKHPNTSKEYGGMIINDKDATNSTMIKEVMKSLAKKVMTLNVFDILNFSKPAKITSPMSLLQCCANELLRTDLLIKASNCEDPIERMKNVACFAISGVHQSPELCRSRAPFNPILGETYQATMKNGVSIYFEQTVHTPPTFNCLMYGPDKSFEYFSNGTIKANLDGLNTIRGWREGKSFLKFKDGSTLTLNNLKTRINGVMMGDRIYNYYGTLTIKDYKNKIECNIVLEDQVNEGMLSKMIWGSKKCQYDEFKIEIKQVNPNTKEKELKAEGYGSWLGQIFFDDVQYWSIFEDNEFNWNQDNLWILPSDSLKREDIIASIKEDYENAQIQKEKLEEMEKNDMKLRKK